MNRFHTAGAVVVLAFCCTLVVQAALAPRAPAVQEYITASSPLPDGSRVVMNYDPRTGAASTTTSDTRTIAATSGRTDNSVVSVQGSIATPAVTQSTVVNNTAPPLQATPSPTTFMTQMPPAEQSAILQANNRITVPSLGYPNTRIIGPATPYQMPTYSQGAVQYQVQRLPTGEVYPYPTTAQLPAASTPPSLLPPLSNQSPYPPTWSPTTRTQQFKPLLQIQNLPPGTYLGQGVLGQPKAFVDGQPLRNLVRYLTY